MALAEDVSTLSFVNEILYIREGRKLGKIRPDEDGYYDIPAAVIGKVSDNNTYYVVDSVVKPLTDPNSMISRKLQDGKLFGEHGHPDLSQCDTKYKVVERLLKIDEKFVSHHFKSIYSGEKLEAGGMLLNAKIKPEGKYAHELQSFLDNPLVNTSLSLRGICDGRMVKDVQERTLKKLITFDNVLGGGYFEASQRYSAAAYEAIQFSQEDINSLYLDHVAMETLNDTELNEIFGSRSIIKETTSIIQIANTKENRSKVLTTLDMIRRY